MSAVTYYCGEDNLVRVSSDEGATWATRSVPGVTPEILYDIMAWPNLISKCTTVGDLGRIWLTNDTGLTWTDVSPVTGMNVKFEEVWNVDPQTSVVVGTNSDLWPVFYKSSNGGTTYNQFNIRDAANPLFDIFKTGLGKTIHFLSDQVGVIGVQGDIDEANLTGYPVQPPGNNMYVLLTVDGGVTWEVTNGKMPINTTLDLPWGIKISYDVPTAKYIINLISQDSVYRSLDSGVTYTATEGTGVRSVHLTWIGDSKIWYTKFAGEIKQSLNLGGFWNSLQTGIPGIPRAAHFYQGPVMVTGFYSGNGILYKTIDEGVTGFISDTTPGQEVIYAVWTEQDIPAKCFLFEDCTNSDRTLVVRDWGCSNCIGVCLESTPAGTTFNIDYQNTLGPVWCLSEEDTTCWRLIGEVNCPDFGGQLCIEQISVIL